MDMVSCPHRRRPKMGCAQSIVSATGEIPEVVVVVDAAVLVEDA